MRAVYAYFTGAAILMIAGLVGSLLNEKAHFLLWLFDFRHPVADYFFYYVTWLGEEHGYVFFGILLWLQSWRKMIVIPALGIIVTLVSYLCKLYFEHERPSVLLNRIQWEGPMSVLGYPVLSGYHSFPSGHTIAAWALFTLLACTFRKMWFSILALFLAVSVAISRVYLMAHFLQDTVAGAMIGLSLGYLAYYLHAKWMKQLL